MCVLKAGQHQVALEVDLTLKFGQALRLRTYIRNVSPVRPELFVFYLEAGLKAQHFTVIESYHIFTPRNFLRRKALLSRHAIPSWPYSSGSPGSARPLH